MVDNVTTAKMRLETVQIQQKGPISMAAFMEKALTHPEYGYYMKRDVFGRKGDFITAPEISEVFGELLGLWCVS